MKIMVRRIKKVISRIMSNQKSLWGNRLLLFKPEHYPTRLSRDMKFRVRMFTRLQSIEPDQKRQIDLDLIKLYARRLAKLNFIEERLLVARKVIFFFVVLVVFLFMGKIYSAYSSYYEFGAYSISSNITFSDYIAEFAPAIIFLFIYGAAFNFLSDIMSLRQHLFYIGIVSLGCLYYLSQSWDRYRIHVFGLVCLQILFLISMAVTLLIHEWFRRRINERHAETVIVHNILFVMKKLDEGLLSNLYSKTIFVNRLEYAALYLEKFTYQWLKTSDEETNIWIKERARQIASSIRDKKKWIYSPKADTSLYLMRSLADFLIHFLRNEWDLLERVDIPKVTQKVIWKTQVQELVRNLIFGLLPISTILLLQYTKIISKPFSDSIIGIAIIWAIINLLWLDPAMKDKLGAVKDVTGLMSPKN